MKRPGLVGLYVGVVLSVAVFGLDPWLLVLTGIGKTIGLLVLAWLFLSAVAIAALVLAVLVISLAELADRLLR